MSFNKRKRRKKVDRTTADIIASKMMFDDRCNGIELPLAHYDSVSDKLCGKPSRKLYEED